MAEQHRLAHVGMLREFDLHRIGKPHRRVGHRRRRIGENDLDLVDRHRFAEIHLHPARGRGLFRPGADPRVGLSTSPWGMPRVVIPSHTISSTTGRRVPRCRAPRPLPDRQIPAALQHHDLTEGEDLLPGRGRTPQGRGRDAQITAGIPLHAAQVGPALQAVGSSSRPRRWFRNSGTPARSKCRCGRPGEKP